MGLFLFFLSASLAGYIAAAPTGCCDSKSVGGVEYRFVGEAMTSAYNCLTNCIYERVDHPGRKFCFALGDLEVVCEDTTTTHSIITENGEVFVQKNTFNEKEETIEMHVPSHRNLEASVVILNQESDTNLLQSGDTCQLSSVPETLNITAMGEQFEDLGTINSSNSKEYCVLKVTESRVGIKERKKLFKPVQEQCTHKPIARTRDIRVPIEDCKSSEIIIVDKKDEIITTTEAITRSTAEPCVIVEACSNVGPGACNYGWTNPDPSAPTPGFSFHQVSNGSICVTCTIGTGCNSTYCACIDIQNKEDLMDCRLCSDPIIENKIEEDGSIFIQTTVYSCKTYDRRALMVISPPHEDMQGIVVVMNAKSDGYWQAAGLVNNLMLKLEDTCYVGTLPSYIYPIDIAIALEEIAAGNTVITEEDENVRYNMLINEGPIVSDPLHELVIEEVCENDDIIQGRAQPITKQESEELRLGGIVFTDGNTSDDEFCFLQNAHAMLNPATGCVRWPNLGIGEKIAVHSIYTAVASVECKDSVDCPLNLCLCSDIVDITSFMACTGTPASTKEITSKKTPKPQTLDIFM